MATVRPLRYSEVRGEAALARLQVREFLPSDVYAAAELLRAAHIRAQGSAPAGSLLGVRFFDARACRELIETCLDSPRTRGAVVEDGSHMCGYLLGEKQLFGPQDFASIYAEPRSIGVPLQGHAVAADANAALVYETLYAFLARDWVADRFFIHNVSVSALDGASAEAWSRLGFGHKSVCAIRPMRPLVPRPRPVWDLVIEEIRGRDDDILETFHRRLMTFQVGAPMFWPYDGEADAKVRDIRAEAMACGEGVAFVARRGGEALGSMLFVPAVFLSPLLVCERMAYLWEGYVEGDARGVGVGSVLLDHAIDRLQRDGVEWCSLHFVSGNPRGGNFWRSKGFIPVELTMKRHVDERVAWTREFAG